MKFLKKFEMFHQTGIDDSGGEVVPKHNPKIQKSVNDFIDDLPPGSKTLVFSWLGMESPKLSDPNFDSEFEKARKKLVEFFQENPNVNISTIDVEKFRVSGDGAPRVQNIGSSSHTNSFRIGQ